jgi:SOS response regulatory protein OraA/RecX
VPRITGLRADPRGRVLVELDGAGWRAVPAEAAAAAGLAVGTEFDRERARALRRALRRSDALARAVRALSARDLSEWALDARLGRAGFTDAERSDAIATLERAGAVDDGRFAVARAATLAGRGYGDAAIRYDLERQGVGGEDADRALEALAPERERAASIARGRAPGAALARYLARRGFGEEAVEAAAEGRVAEEP